MTDVTARAQPRRSRRITRRQRTIFIEVFSAAASVTLAAKAAGINRSHVYDLRNSDDVFAARWEEAEQIAADRLESEAWRRAVEGTSEPLVSAGKLVRGDDGQPMTITRYSDNLLLALLRAHRPEKFRERTTHEHTGSFPLEQIVLLALERRNEEQQPAPLVIDATPASEPPGMGMSMDRRAIAAKNPQG
jgi:hypothetical protein